MLGKVTVGLMVAGLTVGLTVSQVPAQAPVPFRIGVMEGFTGVYGDLTAGEVEAIQMAIEDVGGKVLGRPIELLSADHQTKPDIGSNIARKWFDVDDVKMITGIGTSSVALAVRKIAQEKGRIDINSGAASADLTGPACSPTGAHWTYDTYALAKVTGGAVVKDGGDSWYFLTADYAFGHTLQASATDVVKARGGTVLGAARHPIGTSDFASYLLQAQASRAQIVGLANAGGDTVNAIKAAREFGLTQSGQKMAGLLLYINDIHAIGLDAAAGLMLTEAFYWDMNDQTRAWSQRYYDKLKKMPNMSQAGTYSSVMHYLKAVQAAGTDAPDAVMKQMKAMPINDFYAKGSIRKEDGRGIHDMFLLQVKSQQESTEPWDYFKVVEKIPGEQAFTKLADSKCPLVKK